MCGRFVATTDPALLAEKIDAIDEATQVAGVRVAAGSKKAPGPDHSGSSHSGSHASGSHAMAPNYNVAPTQTVSTVVKRHSEPGDESTRRVRRMRWGLIPSWVKATAEGGPDTKGPLLINARAERVTSSPAFRSSVKSKRCLVPMDGWYEWARMGEGKGAKTPFYLYAGDGEPLFMAGLWSTWRPRRDGGSASVESPLLSCTIITTDAVGSLAEIHDRMPLTISERDWDRWLDPDAPVDEGLLGGHGDLDRVQVREVSRLVNSVRNNGPELIAPVGPEPEQATLL
ncbi:MAG: SOS response-associated peptidase [Mycobacterium sp.]